MRISDWSSDVCSSDLERAEAAGGFDAVAIREAVIGGDGAGGVGLVEEAVGDRPAIDAAAAGEDEPAERPIILDEHTGGGRGATRVTVCGRADRKSTRLNSSH